MKIIDKYILFRFLKIIAVSLLAFIVVVIIVDLIENIDKFIDHNATIDLIILNYIYFIPFIIILALPVSVLLATMFTFGSLAKYHELEVIKATGLSLYRLSLPILTAGFIISIALIIFTDTIGVPASAKKKELKNQKIEKRNTDRGRIRQNVIKAGKDGWIVFARLYNERQNFGENVVIQKIEDNEIKVALRAIRMSWLESDSTWELISATKRSFEDGVETEFSSYDTLIASFLPHTPRVMKHRQKNPQNTRFFELLEVIEMKKWMKQDISKEMVELYLKISFPFANFVIIFLGIPMAANPRRSGGTVGFGISVVVSFIYFIILRTGQTFGHNGSLPPLLAATIGNIVFLVIGLFMFIKARK